LRRGREKGKQPPSEEKNTNINKKGRVCLLSVTRMENPPTYYGDITYALRAGRKSKQNVPYPDGRLLSFI